MLDIVEVDKSPTLATLSTSDLAKNVYAPYGMWFTLICYLIFSYLLFAFPIGSNLTKGFIGPTAPLNSIVRYPIDPLNFIIPKKPNYFRVRAFAQPGELDSRSTMLAV